MHWLSSQELEGRSIVTLGRSIVTLQIMDSDVKWTVPQALEKRTIINLSTNLLQVYGIC